MKTRTGFFLGVLLIMNKLLIAQDNPSFYVEIPDNKNIPVVTHNSRGKRIVYSNTKNIALDKLINSYEIYRCNKVFKSSKKPALQNIYLIECNDLQFLNDLRDNFKQFYPRIENAQAHMLELPDDFGTTGGYVGSDQDELNYIRAPEAWNITTGAKDIIIGISDNTVQTLHEDFEGKVKHVFGNNYPDITGGSIQHGSWVASVAAANTNNGLGMSAIGYDSSIYSATHSWIVGVDTLSLMPGVKVINTAWISSAWPEMYNEVVEDRGVVVVGSAGNSSLGSPEAYVYPAAFKNVISVSAIGHHDAAFYRGSNLYEVFMDSHEYKKNGNVKTFQHNDSVDIVAPAYGIQLADPRRGLNAYLDNGFGTSFASPTVSGAIALMFDVNYCIDPKEVETILKLTAVKIDHLPQNLPYYGKLGAGKLDAFEAVKMARDMARAFGIVEVKDRILYRPWFYKLVTAPYEIKMTNNDVTGGAKLKFRARNNIEILSGNYSPDSGGYIDLDVVETLALNCSLPDSRSGISIPTISDDQIGSTVFVVYPTIVDRDVTILNQRADIENRKSIRIYNILGMVVFQQEDFNSNQVSLNLNRLSTGMYILKVLGSKDEVLHTQKIVKK